MLKKWEVRKGKTTQDSQNTCYTENKRSNQEQKKNGKWNPNRNFPA